MSLRPRSTFRTQESTESMFQLKGLQLLVAVVHVAVAEYPCFVHYADVQSTPLYHFKLPPGNQCWDYCKYLDECQTYSVQLDDLSFCSLYGEDLYKIDQFQNSTSHTILGWKRCLLEQLGKVDLANGQRWSDTENKEVVIQKLENGFCVYVDFAEADNLSHDTQRYPLSWTRTCDGTYSWEISTTKIEAHDTDHIGCKMAIIRLEGTSMCITSVFRNPPFSVPQAFLIRCNDESETQSSNSVLEMGAENQHLLLCPENIQNAWSLMLFRTYHPKFRPITLSSDDMDEDPILTLWNISLPAPSTPVEVSACKHVEAKNGSVEIGEGVPLFLPGEKITVRCNEGFGVEIDHVIREDYVTFCSEEIELHLCAPIQPDQNEQLCAGSGSHGGGHFSIVELVCFLFCFF